MLKHFSTNLIPTPKNFEEEKELIRMLSEALKQYVEHIGELESQLTGSRDSSKPPSSDDTPAQRAERQKKKPTGKKKGGRESHSLLSISVNHSIIAQANAIMEAR